MSNVEKIDENTFEKLLTFLMVVIAITGIFAPLIILARQCLFWLEHGAWLSMPLSNYIDLKPTGYIGLDILLNWFFDLNISIVIILVCFIASFAVRDMQDHVEREKEKSGK